MIKNFENQPVTSTEILTLFNSWHKNQDHLKSNNRLGYEIFQGVLGVQDLPLKNKETDVFKVWENSTDYLFEHLHEGPEEHIIAMASLSTTLINPYLQSLSTEYTETARLKDDLKRLIVANALLNNIADGCVAPMYP